MKRSFAVVLLAPLAILAACGSGGSDDTAAPSPTTSAAPATSTTSTTSAAPAVKPVDHAGLCAAALPVTRLDITSPSAVAKAMAAHGELDRMDVSAIRGSDVVLYHHALDTAALFAKDPAPGGPSLKAWKAQTTLLVEYRKDCM